MTGEIRSTRRKTCRVPTTTNLTWTGLGSNPTLHGERPETERMSRYSYLIEEEEESIFYSTLTLV
jgi:hypothetical protein